MPKTTLQAHYSCSMQKNGSKKQLIFQKLDHFENWQKWPLSKGHRLCIKVSLAQKSKMPKTCQRRLY